VARTVTLGTLVTRCKRRADLENQDDPSSAMVKEEIHLVYAELYGILVESGSSYFDTEATITTDGTNDYPLPADHLVSVGVDYVVDFAGRRRELAELMVQERNWATGLTGAPSAVAWRFSGTNIILHPTPPAGQTYKHVYVPTPPDLSTADDATLIEMATLDGEQFLIWAVSAVLKHKVGMDNRVDREEREAARERVQFWAAQRALNNGRRRIVIDDVDALSQWMPGDYRYGWW
jgi:hypothetical protein